MKKTLVIIIISVALIIVVSGIYFFQGGKTETKQKNEQNNASQSTEESVSFTAKEAYAKLAEEAHKWASDARAYKMANDAERTTKGINLTEDGKSSGWRIWFASPSKKEIRVYYFEDGKIYMYPEASGGRYSYEVSGLDNIWQVDSDKALEIVKSEGITKVTLMYLYSRETLFVTVPKEVRKSSEDCKVWWDIHGEDENGIGKNIYVDASTGDILK